MLSQQALHTCKPTVHRTPVSDIPGCAHRPAVQGHRRLVHRSSSRKRAPCRAAQGQAKSAGDPDDEDRTQSWPGKPQVRSSQEAIDIIGLGTWRLRGRMGGPFEALAAQLEGAWREKVKDLGLFPLPQDLKFVDSLDKDKSFGIWSYIDIPDPDKGEDGYPRLLIENRAYRNRVFRKLHMELAHRQDGLQVLHCVLFPNLDYELPILSFDMVGNESGMVSLAIADPCPIAMDRSLPPIYADTVRELQAKYGLENNRTIPEWGQAIFSDLCIIVRPQDADELKRFLLYSIALHQIHLTFAQHIRPVTEYRESGRQLTDIHAAQVRYCEKQQENSKTLRVLEAAFGQEFAKRYMADVMFDKPADLVACT